jgi:hypothetical protein
MREYREKAGTETPFEPPPTVTEERPRFMMLAQRYGLSDDMNIGGSNETEQTLEQEYQAYVTATRSAVDILKFWEVMILFNSIYISTEDIAAQRDYFPNIIRNGNGLPSYSSNLCPL